MVRKKRKAHKARKRHVKRQGRKAHEYVWHVGT